MTRRVSVLTIAGSDSGAGAGIQADARTIHGLGGYALTAITAVTAQNTQGIKAWQAVSAGLVAQQVKAVMTDFRVGAVKTGLLPGAAAVRAVAASLRAHPRVPLVIDPVVGSTSGTRFLSKAGLRVLVAELIPRAAVVTPNWPEAAALTGLRVTNRGEVEVAAKVLLKTGCQAVLIKGGHAPGKECPDHLLVRGGKGRWFEGSRIATKNTHGTGCVLSAAIAVGLAQGEPIERAVTRARTFLRRSLAAGKRMKWGGRGPALG